eukprot:m.123220 g.123220  ORF g.123220 m.123220 type:complete len:396 (+) comp17278_c2_seq17:2542-3729(+)
MNNTILDDTELYPRGRGACASHADCTTCALDTRCAWCTANASAVSSARCVDRAQTDSTCAWRALEPTSCPRCSVFADCTTCATTGGSNTDASFQCQWNADNTCSRNGNTGVLASGYTAQEAGGRSDGSITRTRAAECPAGCAAATDCSTCLQHPVGEGVPFTSACAWCPDLDACVALADYPRWGALGQCRAYFTDDCPSCRAQSTALSCVAQQGCGWCHEDALAANGTCLGGTVLTHANAFDNGTVTVVDGVCSYQARTADGNVTEVLGDWAFTSLPPIDECEVYGDIICGAHAYCNDTEYSFTCACAAGYKASNTDIPVAVTNPCVPDCCANAVCDLYGDCNRCFLCCCLSWEICAGSAIDILSRLLAERSNECTVISFLFICTCVDVPAYCRC